MQIRDADARARKRLLPGATAEISEERQTRRALNPDSLNPNTCPTGTAHVVEGDEVPQGEVEGDGLPPVNAGAFLDTIGFYCCLFGPNANSSAHASASSS